MQILQTLNLWLDSRFPEEKINPRRASEWACAYDLAAAIEQPIEVGKDIVTISTGVKIEPPFGIATLLLPRSSAAKVGGEHFGLHLGNTIGLVDVDYRGFIMLKVFVPHANPIVIQPFDRIAQMLFVQQPTFTVNVVKTESELSKTVRGVGGFGTSGRGN